ncbi:hypothetical protein ES705_21719 [subsurface metagenome]
MNIWANTLLSVALVSLLSLTGVFFLSFKKEKLKHIQLILVGLATGGFLGGAFFHLLPETFESYENSQLASLVILTGFMFFLYLRGFFTGITTILQESLITR